MSDFKQKNRRFLKPMTTVLALIATSSPLVANAMPNGVNPPTVQVTEAHSNVSSLIDNPLLIQSDDAKFSIVGHYSHSSH
jgi:hypothetical protein